MRSASPSAGTTPCPRSWSLFASFYVSPPLRALPPDPRKWSRFAAVRTSPALAFPDRKLTRSRPHLAYYVVEQFRTRISAGVSDACNGLRHRVRIELPDRLVLAHSLPRASACVLPTGPVLHGRGGRRPCTSCLARNNQGNPKSDFSWRCGTVCGYRTLASKHPSAVVAADVSRGTSLRIRFRFHVLRLQDVNRCPTSQADPNRTPRSHNRKAPRLVEKAGDKARISLDNSRRRIGAV